MKWEQYEFNESLESIAQYIHDYIESINHVEVEDEILGWLEDELLDYANNSNQDDDDIMRHIEAVIKGFEESRDEVLETSM